MTSSTNTAQLPSILKTVPLLLLLLVTSAGCIKRIQCPTILAIDSQTGQIIKNSQAHEIFNLIQPAAPGFHWVDFPSHVVKSAKANQKTGEIHLGEVNPKAFIAVESEGYQCKTIQRPWLSTLRPVPAITKIIDGQNPMSLVAYLEKTDSAEAPTNPSTISSLIQEAKAKEAE